MKRVPGTLIVAGMGAEAPFEALLADLGGVPERLFLIEPAETRGGAHAQRLSGLDGVEPVDGILGETAAPAELICYNLPWLRGLAAPAKSLRMLFPGLRERARIATRTVPAAEVLGDPDALPAPLRLRIDLPGAEPEILYALEAAGTLQTVTLLSMRCGAQAMFEGGWDRARLQSWLKDRQIDLVRVDEDDPDWPELLLTADPAARRIAELEADLARARAEAEARNRDREAAAKKLVAETEIRSEAQKALDETRAALETARKQVEKRQADMEESEAARAKLEADLARLRTEVETRLRQQAETTERPKTDTSALAETQKSLEKTRAALAEARAQTEKHQADFAESETVRARLEADLARSQEEADKRAAHLKEKEAATVRAYRERDKAYSDLALATRMQGLMQSDLDDLRGRYRRSEEKRIGQEELLRKVTLRLQEAAQQLHLLQQASDAESVHELPAPAPSPTAAGKPGSRSTASARRRKRGKKTADGP